MITSVVVSRTGHSLVGSRFYVVTYVRLRGQLLITACEILLLCFIYFSECRYRNAFKTKQNTQWFFWRQLRPSPLLFVPSQEQRVLLQGWWKPSASPCSGFSVLWELKELPICYAFVCCHHIFFLMFFKNVPHTPWIFVEWMNTYSSIFMLEYRVSRRGLYSYKLQGWSKTRIHSFYRVMLILLGILLALCLFISQSSLQLLWAICHLSPGETM